MRNSAKFLVKMSVEKTKQLGESGLPKFPQMEKGPGAPEFKELSKKELIEIYTKEYVGLFKNNLEGLTEQIEKNERISADRIRTRDFIKDAEYRLEALARAISEIIGIKQREIGDLKNNQKKILEDLTKRKGV